MHNFSIYPVVTGMYFATTMLMVSVCLMMNVITTNLYARKDSAYGPPMWLVSTAQIQGALFFLKIPFTGFHPFQKHS